MAKKTTVTITSIMDLLGDAASGADLSEVAVALVRRFGGAGGLANSAFEVYTDAPKGSQVRSRILQQVLSIVEKHSAVTNDSNDIDLTDTEFAELLESLVGEHGTPDDAQAASGHPGSTAENNSLSGQATAESQSDLVVAEDT